MKTLEVLVLCLSILYFLPPPTSALPTNRNDKDERVTPLSHGDNKIYGTEPYQLQFQEPPLQPHAHHNYYPSGSQKSSNALEPHRQQHPYRHHVHQPQQHHQYQRQRPHDQHDYDPFYFSARNGVVPAGTRSRRNSKFRDLWSDDLSNHLLNEDVHFFRRGQSSGLTSSGGTGSSGLGRREGGESAEFIHKDNHHRLPFYGEYPVVPYFPSSRMAHHHRVSEGEGRQDPLSSSAATSYDRRGEYPDRYVHSNHLDFYDAPRPRHHPHIPKLFVPEPERYSNAHPREPIDGWSVQVGTHLRVHDDGRERNPGRFYVRDEKPVDGRRYPHRYDYVRP